MVLLGIRSSTFKYTPLIIGRTSNFRGLNTLHHSCMCFILHIIHSGCNFLDTYDLHLSLNEYPQVCISKQISDRPKPLFLIWPEPESFSKSGRNRNQTKSGRNRNRNFGCNSSKGTIDTRNDDCKHSYRRSTRK